MTDGIKAERTGRLSVCRGCDIAINDQYILRVAPDMEWHAACLKCADCHQFLDEYCTCFVRDGRTYCKRDYVRLFGAKCDKCSAMFERTDLVMRARNKIYHLDCFRCVACTRQLLPGDEFALREDGLYCKLDFDAVEKKANAENNNTTNINHNDVKVLDTKPLRKERREGKATRVRTVLNEKQLQTLRKCYAFNCRPDALLKEQLVEMTGLTSKFIRTWFQNKRCKDTKIAIRKKQMQYEKEKQMVLQGLSGVPMVASSPQRHDGGPLNVSVGGPLDVTAYQPPWKSLVEFAQSQDPDRIDPSSNSQYQQLMSQMHGFGSEMIPASDILCHPGLGSLPPHLHQQQPPHAPLTPNQQTPLPLTPSQVGNQQPPPSSNAQNPHMNQQGPNGQLNPLPPNGHQGSESSKFDFGAYDESTHSDSYVSYLESDDSMTTPLSGSTSP